mgnify:CR=1 FL=1
MLCTGAASVNNLSGPVGIVKNMGDTSEQLVTGEPADKAYL